MLEEAERGLLFLDCDLEVDGLVPALEGLVALLLEPFDDLEAAVSGLESLVEGREAAAEDLVPLCSLEPLVGGLDAPGGCFDAVPFPVEGLGDVSLCAFAALLVLELTELCSTNVPLFCDCRLEDLDSADLLELVVDGRESTELTDLSSSSSSSPN